MFLLSTNSIERLDKTLKRQRENTKNREKVQEDYKNKTYFIKKVA